MGRCGVSRPVLRVETQISILRIDSDQVKHSLLKSGARQYGPFLRIRALHCPSPLSQGLNP